MIGKSFCAITTIVAVTVLLLVTGVYAETVSYGVGGWSDILGNHRARIEVTEGADAVLVHIPWRCRNINPEQKATLVVDANTGDVLQNVVRVNINREFGDIVFQPVSGIGDYYVYYLPAKESENLKNTNEAIPKAFNPKTKKYDSWRLSGKCNAKYAQPCDKADKTWLAKNNLTKDGITSGRWKELPRAKVIEIQAINEFHSFYPMEIIATETEVQNLHNRYENEVFLVFCEDRKYPIKMTDELPLRWIEKNPGREFIGQACRNEFYVFQIGIYAFKKPINNVEVIFSDFKSSDDKLISADAFRCFNLGGSDCYGRTFRKTVSVKQGKVQALWCGVRIPSDAARGDYQGMVKVRCDGAEKDIKFVLSVSDESLKDSGDSELWRHSRLRWLDSVIGIDEGVISPYIPLGVDGRVISCLGRKVKFAETGLPESIQSNGLEILAGPVELIVETSAGKTIWNKSRTCILKTTNTSVIGESINTAEKLELVCRWKMEFDGYINFRATLKADEDISIENIRLQIPYKRNIATYMMGLGCKGGYRPKTWDWDWGIRDGTNKFWIGEVMAGLYCVFKEGSDFWDTEDSSASDKRNFWSNDGRGGCTVVERNEQVEANVFTGKTQLKAGEQLILRFGFLITPFHPYDLKKRGEQRIIPYLFDVKSPDDAIKNKATIIHIHQGNDYNKNINYPFLNVDKIHDYVADAHQKGLKVITYYTMRELSNYVTELWALRSLDDEIFLKQLKRKDSIERTLLDANARGDSWLQEHLEDDYVCAWQQGLGNGEVDAAMQTANLSRWCNYYLEGLRWLIQNVGIDGIYLDGISYDREVMKRVRKVLCRECAGGIIDHHSPDSFKPRDIRINSALKYMELFPFIDSLWYGELFQYDESPDYWLVELSGIPFGLHADMLQHPINPWRGMVYGMSYRLWPVPEKPNPAPLWALWDNFGIEKAKMFGYWDPNCPVKTNHSEVLATSYVREGKTLIAIASWARPAVWKVADPVRIRLKINWAVLALDPAKARLYAPPIEGIQQEKVFSVSDEIPVDCGKGWLLILQNKD